MNNSLSQAEIDALLKGISTSDIDSVSSSDIDEHLTAEEIDAIGEIGNISIGTSATTLFALLHQKVIITTPQVTITNWEKLSKEHTLPYVAVRVKYTSGLEGASLLILKENDVKVITNLMMGGNGEIEEGELTDMHLSAISEAMNQMIGSAATSMSSMLNKTINISPPTSFIIKFNTPKTYEEFDNGEAIVKIAFKMIIGDLVDSEIMQLMPVSFAKALIKGIFDNHTNSNEIQQIAETEVTKDETRQKSDQTIFEDGYSLMSNMNTVEEETYDKLNIKQKESLDETIKVQPVQFKPFDEESTIDEKRNIENVDLVMDIPLEVSVELGRTQKLIKDILKFNNGTIIELDKLAGDPVDVYVNEKKIAKGEVVVIDDSFAVRITDIVHPTKRV